MNLIFSVFVKNVVKLWLLLAWCSFQLFDYLMSISLMTETMKILGINVFCCAVHSPAKYDRILFACCCGVNLN